jgi:hypothetical protein
MQVIQIGNVDSNKFTTKLTRNHRRLSRRAASKDGTDQTEASLGTHKDTVRLQF